MRFPENVKITVTQADINSATCADPTHCMIHFAVKRAIGGHGYVKVDARGVFVTRRDDYREHAVLPKHVYQKMLQFDRDKSSLRPFSFTLKFKKTTKIQKYTAKQLEHRENTRRALRDAGKLKKWNPAERYTGIAFSEKRT
jgi:hypothetical protein